MHRYVTHHKSWLYRAKSLRKWVIVLSLVWGIMLSLDFLVERKYSSGQWSYLRWVLWATSEVNVKISFLSSFRCNVAHPTFLYCVFTLIAARSFFFCFVFLRNVWLLPAHKLDLFVKSGAKTSLPSRTYSICASCDIGLLLYPAVYICGLHGRPELVGALKKCRVNGYDNIRWSRGACVLWRKKKCFREILW